MLENGEAVFPTIGQAPIEACFLDVDGVIHDLDLLSRQWDGLVGECLAMLLGGDAEGWSNANRVAFQQVWSGNDTWPETPLERWQHEAVLMLDAMCDHLGLERVERADSLDTMRKVEVRALRQCTAVIPGAREAILELRRRFAVHMATGNLTWRVDALLEGLRLQEAVGLRSGPDLVSARKSTTLFYDRAFRMAGVKAHQAVVVDDSPLQIALATAVGAHTIHVAADCDGSCSADAHVAHCTDLPGALSRLQR